MVSQLSPDVGPNRGTSASVVHCRKIYLEREDDSRLIHPNRRDLHRLLGSGLFLFPKPSF